MLIENNQKIITFREVEQGNVFIYADKAYMKTAEKDDINAVYLGTGSLACFSDSEKVESVKAKLVIADKELHSETVAKPANIDKLIYLKGIIKAAGDTQRQLCKQMGVCIGNLNAKLNGRVEFNMP